MYASKAGVVAGDTVDKLVEKLPDSVKEKVEPIVSKVTGKGKSDGTDTPADEPGPDTPTGLIAPTGDRRPQRGDQRAMSDAASATSWFGPA